MLHILALEPEIQDRIRQEFATARENLTAGTESIMTLSTECLVLTRSAGARETLRL